MGPITKRIFQKPPSQRIVGHHLSSHDSPKITACHMIDHHKRDFFPNDVPYPSSPFLSYVWQEYLPKWNHPPVQTILVSSIAVIVDLTCPPLPVKNHQNDKRMNGHTYHRVIHRLLLILV
ncbi:hypothetical protein E2320_006077 [Naja naja]|nr:hypothetical protein E2320_006077 [Naja naja]